MGQLCSCFHDTSTLAAEDANYVDYITVKNKLADQGLAPAVDEASTPRRPSPAYNAKTPWQRAFPAANENTPEQIQQQHTPFSLAPGLKHAFSPGGFFGSPGLRPSEGFQSPNMGFGM